MSCWKWSKHARTGQNTFETGQNTQQVNAVVYTPDGKRIVSASADMSIRIWDAFTGETRNPKPETRNLKPETRNLKPETRN